MATPRGVLQSTKVGRARRSSRGAEPYYSLEPDWVSFAPILEQMYHSVLTAGTYYEPTRREVFETMCRAGKKRPDPRSTSSTLVKMGREAPNRDLWIAAEDPFTGDPTFKERRVLYEEYLWTLMPVRSWLAAFTGIDDASKITA
jgi:hypothetical protein